MQAATTKPRIWIGHWLMGVAALHTVFAVVVFGKVLRTMAERGLFNSVGTDPLVGAVTWFVLFGFVLALLFAGGHTAGAQRPNRGSAQARVRAVVAVWAGHRVDAGVWLLAGDCARTGHAAKGCHGSPADGVGVTIFHGPLGLVMLERGSGVEHVHAASAPRPAQTMGCVQARCCCAGWGAAAVLSAGHSRARCARLPVSGWLCVALPSARLGRIAQLTASIRCGAIEPITWRASSRHIRAAVAGRPMRRGRGNKSPSSAAEVDRKRRVGPGPSTGAGARRWRRQTECPIGAPWCPVLADHQDARGGVSAGARPGPQRQAAGAQAAGADFGQQGVQCAS